MTKNPAPLRSRVQQREVIGAMIGVAGAAVSLFPAEHWAWRIILLLSFISLTVAFLLANFREEATNRDAQERRDEENRRLIVILERHVAVAGSSLGTRMRRLAVDIELFLTKRLTTQPRSRSSTLVGRWARLSYNPNAMQRWRTITIAEFREQFAARLRDVTDELRRLDTTTGNVTIITFDDSDLTLSAHIGEIARQLLAAADNLRLA